MKSPRGRIMFETREVPVNNAHFNLLLCRRNGKSQSSRKDKCVWGITLLSYLTSLLLYFWVKILLCVLKFPARANGNFNILRPICKLFADEPSIFGRRFRGRHSRLCECRSSRIRTVQFARDDASRSPEMHSRAIVTSPTNTIYPLTAMFLLCL